jgi:hypothetical protein
VVSSKAATPIETVSTPGISLARSVCNALSEARISSARMVLMQGAFGQDERDNSSPPYRQARSSERTARSGISPTKRRALSPAGCSEGVVIAFEIIDIEHHQRERPPFATSTENLVFEEFLHVAAVVEAGEGVVNGLQSESLAQVEIGNRESDVLGDGGSHCLRRAKPSESVEASVSSSSF